MAHSLFLQAIRCSALTVLGFFIAAAAADEKDNSIYKELLDKGVTLSDGTLIPVSKPVMADGLNAEAQRKVIEGVSNPRFRDSFLKGERYDRFELKIGGDPPTQQKPTADRTVDLYFIVNGKLETVADKNFMKQQFGDGNGKAAFLTDDELKAHNLTVVNNDIIRERYAHADFDLFNMVQIKGTGHGIQSHGKDSEIVAYILDPAFASDPKYPNEWKSISLGPGGKVFGASTPYSGSGAYVKVTRLLNTKTPQIFVEYHLVFEEPFGWFKGGPTLTSKLPNKFEADVRAFRKDIHDFEVQKQAAAANPAPAAKGNSAKTDDKKADDKKAATDAGAAAKKN